MKPKTKTHKQVPSPWDPIMACAVQIQGEKAWLREDLGKVFSFCRHNSICICQGEAWLVFQRTEWPARMPVSMQKNPFAARDAGLAVTSADEYHVACGLIPLREGVPVVLDWGFVPSADSAWESQVEQSVEECQCVISQARLEEDIAPEWIARIHYHLWLKDQNGTQF
jgi:hypothetical protein